MMINIPISVAELFDKISILQIKASSSSDQTKLEHVNNELELLLNIAKEHKIADFLSSDLYKNLVNVNQKMWDLCDKRRKMDSENKFDQEYIEESRNEYFVNDQRARIQFKINKKFDSSIVEVKYYKNF